MKKESILVITLFALITATSCKKNHIETEKPSKNTGSRLTITETNCSEIDDPVTYYSEKLANDSLFQVFIYGIIDNHDSIFQSVKESVGSADEYAQFVSAYENLNPADHEGTLQLLMNYNIDTALFLDRIAASVTDGVFVYEDNQCFFELDPELQMQILTNVLAGRNQALRLTWGEFTVCAVSSIGSFVAGYGGVIGQVFNMLTQGPAYLGWSEVWGLSKQIVRSSVPWYAVVGTMIEFGACLWAAW